jgi:tetratricopeptide (TPR) repeat protein
LTAAEYPKAGKSVPQATLMIAKRITPAKTMRGARVFLFMLFAGAFLSATLFAVTPAAAQASALEKGPPPPYEEAPPAPPEPAVPVFDPLHANKAVEVGTFYMKRGNYDAAIERFQDATHFQPSLARPYYLLGVAYERKGELDKALAAYRKYLEVYRTAPDREKILKHIEKLESQAERPQTKQKLG